MLNNHHGAQKNQLTAHYAVVQALVKFKGMNNVVTEIILCPVKQNHCFAS